VLLEQIAFRLLALDRYPDALRLLKPLAESDSELQRRRLQEQYAHALIRADDGAAEDDQLLLRAEGILRALRHRYGSTGEVLGLLGSAAKRRVERAIAAGQTPPPAYLEAAISAYRSGLESDPGDPYPGINAVALLRLRGQHWGGMEDDLDEARAMLPVVLFAASRPDATDDEWTNLTLGECHLHAYLLDGDRGRLRLAQREYRRGAGRMEPQQRRSADRQLRLMRAAGDPPDVIDPLVDLFAA
jgi:tetratricopeptide (TPR) repeat protein